MGVFYVTRADHWARNQGKEISAAEWLAYVAADPELKLESRNGTHFALWLGKSKYDEPWFDWCQGNISTQWPDTALYRKMLQIASALGARVQYHDGTVYTRYSDWCFEPIEQIA